MFCFSVKGLEAHLAIPGNSWNGYLLTPVLIAPLGSEGPAANECTRRPRSYRDHRMRTQMQLQFHERPRRLCSEGSCDGRPKRSDRDTIRKHACVRNLALRGNARTRGGGKWGGTYPTGGGPAPGPKKDRWYRLRVPELGGTHSRGNPFPTRPRVQQIADPRGMAGAVHLVSNRCTYRIGASGLTAIATPTGGRRGAVYDMLRSCLG